MSKLGVLGKILQLGSIAAAPFTGGLSTLVGASVPTIAGGLTAAGGLGSLLSNGSQVAGAVSPVLGGAADARAKAEAEEERNQLTRDQLNLSSANSRDKSILDRAGVDLDQRKFQLTAPAARLSTGVRGSMVANAHPVTVGTGGPMTLSSGRTINPIHFGGFDASMINDKARELGDAVTDQALQSQLKGDKFDPLPTVDFPTATPAPDGGLGDKLLGGAATGSALLGAAGPVLSRILAQAKKPKFAMPGVDPLSALPGANVAAPTPPPPQLPVNPAIYGGVRF